jgi:ABC-2 type transport system ATP-binding protein
VLGLDPWREGEVLHRKIGVIPQDFRFFDKITPKEAIEYYAALFGVHVSWKEMLERVALLDKASARFDTLSGGQKQKLGLALSLVNDPPLLFLDEPTSGLDPSARRTIWELIRSMKRAGRTVFLTTHYLEEAEMLADTVAIIHHGKIIARGTPAEIIRAHGRKERLSLDGPPELAHYISLKLGLETTFEEGHVLVELRDKHDAARILAAADESGLSWQSLATVKDSLEDVFVTLVGQMDEGEMVKR